MAWTNEQIIGEVNKLADAVSQLAGIVHDLARTPDYVKEEVTRLEGKIDGIQERTGESSGGSSGAADSGESGNEGGGGDG